MRLARIPKHIMRAWFRFKKSKTKRPLPEVTSPFWSSKFWPSFRPWLLGTSIILGIAFLLVPSLYIPTVSLHVGDISPNDIKAPFDFVLEDTSTTLQRQKAEAQKVLAVYDFDPIGTTSIQRLNKFFKEKKMFYKSSSAIPASGDLPGQKTPVEYWQLKPKERWSAFLQKTHFSLSFDTFSILEESLFDPILAQAAQKLVEKALAQGVVSSRELLLLEKGKGIMKRDLKTRGEKVIREIDKILDINQAKVYIQRITPGMFQADPLSQQAAVELAQIALHPNLFFNKRETEERRNQARQRIKPVFFQIKEGEMIIREGEKTQAEHLAKLKELAALRQGESAIYFVLGIVLFSALVISLMLKGLDRLHLPIKSKELLILSLLLLVGLGINRLWGGMASSLYPTSEEAISQGFYYAIPFAAGPMLVTILLGVPSGLAFALTNSILTGLQFQLDFNLFLLCSLGSFGAVLGTINFQHRNAIFHLGSLVCGINLTTIIALNLVQGKSLSLEIAYQTLAGVSGGMVAAVLTLGALPLLESLFEVTTNFKLLELSNLNQPLLAKLSLEAPGTYHHSIIVGSLCESAAEVIGANPLLARVSAYYHDIGKIAKPGYFIENQSESEGKHQNLNPSMSSLVVLSHAKEGIELARKFHLPPIIIDAIQQHHGTRLVRFFYHKAKEQEEVQFVPEEPYRYSGPKPQTKEIGILMLADAVEAASRSLGEFSPGRIQAMVKKIINDICNEEQLGQCDLTFRNLTQIVESFSRSLGAIYHLRVEYPENQQEQNNKTDIWKYRSKIAKESTP